MRKSSSVISLVFASFLLASCATMDGYNSEFSCPQKENGKCVSVQSAYEESLAAAEHGEKGAKQVIESAWAPDPAEERAFLQNDVKNFDSVVTTYEKCLKDPEHRSCEKERQAVKDYYNTAEDRGRAKEVHSTNMEERLTKIAAMEQIAEGSGIMPVRQADAVMQVTIMPYQTDDGFMVSERTLWVVVAPGQWTWTTNIGSKKSKNPKLGESY